MKETREGAQTPLRTFFHHEEKQNRAWSSFTNLAEGR